MRARLIVIGALLALVGAPAAHARGCSRTLPRGPAVPSPIVFRTACGVFELRTDGTLVYGRVPRWAPAWAPSATSHPDPRTWVAHPSRRLAVYRDGRLLWHSHTTGGSDNVAIGHGHVAFTVYRNTGTAVWIAPLDGRERMVGRKEQVVGWTRAGLVTQRGNRILLRTAEGRLSRRVATARIALPDHGDVVLLTTEGRIVHTDGWRSRVLVDLRRPGKRRDVWLTLLAGGVLQVTWQDRVAFFSPFGRRLASAAFPRGAGIVGDPLLLPDGSGVLFVVNRRRHPSDPGVETVYRLDRGRRRPRPLYTARARELSCAQWTTLTYRSGRVLFTATEGGLAVLDPAGRRAPLDLARLAARLVPRPPANEGISAFWKS